MRALAAGEVGAFLALAEVGSESSALAARQASVELARDRELGVVAGDSLLELLAEGAAPSVEGGKPNKSLIAVSAASLMGVLTFWRKRRGGES